MHVLIVKAPVLVLTVQVRAFTFELIVSIPTAIVYFSVQLTHIALDPVPLNTYPLPHSEQLTVEVPVVIVQAEQPFKPAGLDGLQVMQVNVEVKANPALQESHFPAPLKSQLTLGSQLAPQIKHEESIGVADGAFLPYPLSQESHI